MTINPNYPRSTTESTVETILEPEPLTTADKAKLEQVEGIVFDIQRYSLHDGPGLRTNVFLKGCPLRCDWCANPESQELQPELVLFSHNCMACGQFEEVCPVCWGGSNGRGWSRSSRGSVAGSSS